MFLNIDLKLLRAEFLILNYKSDGKRQISMFKSKFGTKFERCWMNYKNSVGMSKAICEAYIKNVSHKPT